MASCLMRTYLAGFLWALRSLTKLANLKTASANSLSPFRGSTTNDNNRLVFLLVAVKFFLHRGRKATLAPSLFFVWRNALM